MPYTITQVDLWVGTIKDRPGGLAEKLEALSRAGIDIEFIMARRAPGKPGTGVLFLSPIKGAAQIRVAKRAGINKINSLYSIRVEGPSLADLGARVTGALARAGINLRSMSATSRDRNSVCYFVFDAASDADRASRILNKILKTGTRGAALKTSMRTVRAVRDESRGVQSADNISPHGAH